MFEFLKKKYEELKAHALALVAAVPAASAVLAVPALASEAGPASPSMAGYLDQVGTVFTWILAHITELITFILGNPFLAVSLVLFMCGAVISFFIRIKNA